MSLLASNPPSVLALLFGPIGLAIAGTVVGLLYLGIDRILVARMQSRVGPPLVQPFRDVGKLMMKESIIPNGSLRWLFQFAPVMCVMGSVALLLYIPLFGQPALFEGSGDAMLIIYLLTVPSLALVAGGFASSSPYASVGAQREIVVMIGYEFPLSVTVVSLAWRILQVTDANAFALSTMAQYPIWDIVGPLGFIGAILLLISLIAVTPGELGRVPFDIAEAETELAGGLMVEYSGRNLALFYLGNAVRGFAVLSLMVALFFPYGIATSIGISGTVAVAVVDGLFFLLKVFLAMFVAVTVVRSAMARLKVNQTTVFYLMIMTIVSLLGLLLLWADMVL
ncbi:MAG: NADH-quinone oxidoreductase subunit H [Dehalococcoidia bacterium]|nr:NADH-quinone oxidoreductase subunit H [Dehalococcoidia bacterium]